MDVFIGVLGLAAKSIPGKKDNDPIKDNIEDSKVPMTVLDAIQEHIVNESNPSESTLREWTKACRALLKEYAMTEYHRNQLVDIKRIISSKNRELGDTIDMTLFSRCAFWPGKILFTRF
jgi:hypothetical protein